MLTLTSFVASLNENTVDDFLIRYVSSVQANDQIFLSIASRNVTATEYTDFYMIGLSWI
jgi:hypothetical protein